MEEESTKLLPPPILLTSHGEESPKQSLYNLLDNLHQTACIPVLSDKSVIGSAYGWLVLLERGSGFNVDEGDCCLWNPKSMEMIQLPELDFPYHYNRCILSKPPNDPDCFLVFSKSNCKDQLVCRLGDRAVFKVKTKEKEEGYKVLAMVTFRGMIYGIIEDLQYDYFQYEFVTIHMVGDDLEVTTLYHDDEDEQLPWVAQLTPSWVTFNMSYLIECGNDHQLLLVTKMLFNHYLESGVHFRVFRVDVDGKVCEELENLDGRTVFIGYYGNGLCRSSESFGPAIKHNSIYYTNSNGVFVNVYDLDERSTTVLQPYPDVDDIDPETSESFWVDIPDILNSVMTTAGAT